MMPAAFRAGRLCLLLSGLAGLPCASADELCTDKAEHCASWAENGECTRNPHFMQQHCTFSCGQCPPTAAEILADVDADNDGKITLEELVARITKVSRAQRAADREDPSFEEENEEESVAEMQSPSQHVKDAFAEADKDGDGYVSLGEILHQVDQDMMGMYDGEEATMDEEMKLELKEEAELTRNAQARRFEKAAEKVDQRDGRLDLKGFAYFNTRHWREIDEMMLPDPESDAKRLMKSVDVDGDGVLTAVEVAAHEHMHHSTHPQHLADQLKGEL